MNCRSRLFAGFIVLLMMIFRKYLFTKNDTTEDRKFEARFYDKNPDYRNDSNTKDFKTISGCTHISADKMNMLYIGLDNPVYTCVDGVEPARTSTSISGGASMKPDSIHGPGHFIIKPDGSVRQITVRAEVIMPD